MTVSTDGIICFGVLIDEDVKLPWDDYAFDDWWIETVHGYEPPFQLYDSDGEYLNGVKASKEETTQYYAHRRDFEKEHPQTIQPVNCCHSDYPIWILAVPSSVRRCHRGYPLPIMPSNLKVEKEEWDTLHQFCVQFGIEIKDNSMGWWLASYWDG